ncbi:MAG: hypothetical protein JXA98_08865 [Methanosarcinaceae archaeon]|nr:hypothetical protein [Methanosarcinaceae archaeon]
MKMSPLFFYAGNMTQCSLQEPNARAMGVYRKSSCRPPGTLRRQHDKRYRVLQCAPLYTI